MSSKLYRAQWQNIVYNNKIKYLEAEQCSHLKIKFSYEQVILQEVVTFLCHQFLVIIALKMSAVSGKCLIIYVLKAFA